MLPQKRPATKLIKRVGAKYYKRELNPPRLNTKQRTKKPPRNARKHTQKLTNYATENYTIDTQNDIKEIVTKQSQPTRPLCETIVTF